MGQYHLTVNLDKREFIHPHKLSNGLKLWEQFASEHGVKSALVMLLAVSNGRGGGDLEPDPHADDPDQRVIGRWGGDRIAIVGDYVVGDDLAPEHDAATLYARCRDGEFRDISDLVCAAIERETGGKFTGSGWRDFKLPNEAA